MRTLKSKITCTRRGENPKSKILLALVALFWLAFPAVASAHPLGNFTVNRYSRLEVGAAGVKIYYVLDMAEIPTFQEKDAIDLNKDGQLGDNERIAYRDRKAPELLARVRLTLDEQPAQLKLVEKELSFPQGQGGLQTLRLTATFETAALPSGSKALLYQDTNYSDRLGWKEIVVRNATGVALEKSSAPTKDSSDELRTYPEDLLANPLALTSAQVGFRLDPSVVVNDTGKRTGTNLVKADDPLAALVNGELTPLVILFALGAALILGAFHALSPGHGKTVVAAYLVGSRGTARHAVFLGLTVTITHTIGVFALGLITLFAAQFILPERIYPWLNLISGLTVVVMGLSLFRSRLLQARAGTTAQLHEDHDHSEHAHDEHSHDHDQPHTHDHGPGHSHDHDHSHDDHDHSHEEAKVLVLAHASAAEHEHSQTSSSPQHSHDDHDHSHDHHDHPHSPLVHSHGGKSHSHLPPGADGTPVTWKQLLFFGISAGLLPCPSALVLMLSAIALDRTALGLILTVVFSFGLAATLTAMGLLLIYARRFLTRFELKSGRAGQVIRYLPIVSAVVIFIIGLAISYEGLLKVGLF